MVPESHRASDNGEETQARQAAVVSGPLLGRRGLLGWLLRLRVLLLRRWRVDRVEPCDMVACTSISSPAAA